MIKLDGLEIIESVEDLNFSPQAIKGSFLMVEDDSTILWAFDREETDRIISSIYCPFARTEKINEVAKSIGDFTRVIRYNGFTNNPQHLSSTPLNLRIYVDDNVDYTKDGGGVCSECPHCVEGATE